MVTFGYGRVSTGQQTAYNQLIELRNAGYTINDEYWFVDEGVSGKTPAMNRPQFNRMVTLMRRGETLVVSKLDRLGRDAIDVLSTLRLLDECGIRVAVLQLGAIDVTSSAGKLMLSMLASVAEMERDLIVERTKAGLARAVVSGKKLGRPRKTNDTERQEILTALGRGETVSATAREFGVSRATIISIRQCSP